MKSKLFQGAVFVTIATFFVKVLSIVYKIPYQNITGDKGFYIYQQMYPVYALIVASATFAFPLAISENISKDQNEKETLSSSLFMFLAISIVMSIVILLFNPLFGIIFNDRKLAPLFYPLIFVLLLIPFVSIIRGSLYANIDKMNHVGVSVVLEQLFRVVFIIIVLYAFLQAKISHIYDVAFYSLSGYIIGLGVALFYLIFHIKFRNIALHHFNLNRSFKILRRGLFLLVSASILILLQLIDSLTVLKYLSINFGLEQSMEIKGVYDRSLPLIQTAVFFVSPLLSIFIPHLKSKDDSNKLVMLIIFISMPATSGLYYILGDVNQLLFQDQQYNSVLRVSLLIIFLYSILLTFASLTKNNIKLIYILGIGLFIKYILNVFLIKEISIMGASVSSVLSLFVMLILIIYDNRHNININMKLLFKMMIASMMMILSIYSLSQLSFFDHLISKIMIGMISYLAMTYILRIKKDDLIIN